MGCWLSSLLLFASIDVLILLSHCKHLGEPWLGTLEEIKLACLLSPSSLFPSFLSFIHSFFLSFFFNFMVAPSAYGSS